MKLTKSEQAMSDAFDVLLAAGFVRAGHTRSETVRVPTRDNPVYGRGGYGGGEERTFGGRARFHKPSTDRYVTVGKMTTCFYMRVGRDEPTDFVNVDTKDTDRVRQEATRGAISKPSLPPIEAGSVTKITPRHTYMDGIVQRTAAEVVEVTTVCGKVHHFVTGSINGVPDAKVGDEGMVYWVSTASSFLPYWKKADAV